MKSTLIIASLLTLISCGKKEHKVTETVQVPMTVTEQSEINSLVSAKNNFRQLNGQSPLVQGLQCQLFTFTSGDRIQSSIAGHNTLGGLALVTNFVYSGLFNQPNTNTSVGMNVLPEPFKSLYKNNYLIRCQGQIVLTDSMNYIFELSSDDASVFYINGSKVIDNDNAHGNTTVSAIRLLERGVHTFRIDYAQLGGDQAFVLKMNNESINPARYYR